MQDSVTSSQQFALYSVSFSPKFVAQSCSLEAPTACGSAAWLEYCRLVGRCSRLCHCVTWSTFVLRIWPKILHKHITFDSTVPIIMSAVQTLQTRLLIQKIKYRIQQTLVAIQLETNCLKLWGLIRWPRIVTRGHHWETEIQIRGRCLHDKLTDYAGWWD